MSICFGPVDSDFNSLKVWSRHRTPCRILGSNFSSRNLSLLLAISLDEQTYLFPSSVSYDLVKVPMLEVIAPIVDSFERQKPERRANIYPQFSDMKTPSPPLMPAYPTEDEEEKKEEEEKGAGPEKEEPDKPEKQQ
ncbi:hypothetical protein Nepgr_005512 [Nepenthes gracilis]|uniref:Uncharacterized protein n=1 Tax=Nepenthes gracilis TaxID=150966 RepID=A0AAD3XGI9_NEPGR|nr:hypothetical protein Nepgr_005512 [Nepenthes gracilis]